MYGNVHTIGEMAFTVLRFYCAACFLVFAGLPVWIKEAVEVFPALVVVLVKLLTRLQTPLGHSHTER